MLTTKQRVDKVKQWIRQSYNNPDLFNVATVYDEVEGVSVQDCSKCSFSSPGSGSGVFVSVSQIYSHKNVTEYFESKPIAVENLENKIVKTGKCVSHAGEPENLAKIIEDQEGLEHIENNPVENRKSVEGLEYLENNPVENRKPMEDEKRLEYLENSHLKNVNNGNDNDKLENVDRRPVVDSEARELVRNGEELGNLRSKIVENVRERGIEEYGEETGEKNRDNVRKLKKNPRRGRNSKKNEEREKSFRRRVEKEEEEKEEVREEEVEEGKLIENPRRGRNSKNNKKREKSFRRVEKEEDEEKEVGEEEMEEVEKGGEIKVQEEREVEGGGGAEGCSKRNFGERRQPKKNCKGKNNLKNNSGETQNFEKSSSSVKTLQNWKIVDNYQQNNGSEEEGEGGGRDGEEEGGRGRNGEEEEKERKDDVSETRENIETNEEEKKIGGESRFSTKNKISSQGIRVYINKKKPSWKKFIRTPCSTWSTADRNVEKSNKKRNNTEKYLREINKFIENLDLDEQLRKGRKRRRMYYNEGDNICTPQEKERKGTDLEEEREEGEEHSSDTDWANEKNIDLRQTFVKNRQRFRERYTDSFQKLKVKELENTPKENEKNSRKRRRLLDCYSVWDEKEDNGHKKELGETERVYEDDGIGYNFEKFSEGCGKVLDDLFRKERMEEEGKTTKKRKRKGRGESGGEEQSVKGNEETSKENQGKLGEDIQIQQNNVKNIEMNDSFGHLDTIMNNTNFEVRMSVGENFENTQILNDPLLDAEGYLTGFGILDSTEKENSIENNAGNKNVKVLSETVHLRNDQPAILYGAVQSSNNPLNENVQCEDNAPVVLNKTVQFESIIHEDLHQDISVKSKYRPLILNTINTVSSLQNIPVQSKKTSPKFLDNSVPDNASSEIVRTENIGHLNERNSILKTHNDGVICDINKNATTSEKISNNEDLSGGIIEKNKISSNKVSQMPDLRIVLTRCDELIRKSDEKRRENQGVDKEEMRNEKIIEKRNKFFVTKSQKTSKQEKFIAKYISSIKKASNRARKYRKLKIKVVKSENLKASGEKSSVSTEKITEKKFNMTKFCRKSQSGSSGWSDIEERLKQIDVKRTFTKLKVVKLYEQGVENSRNHEKVGVNNDISGGNYVRSDKNNENSRKNSKDIKKSGERKMLTDLGLGRYQSTKPDGKKRQNKSKQNKKEEDETKRKLAKIDFSKEQGRMDEIGEEDEENRRNSNEKGKENNVHFRRMADKENKVKLNEKGEENAVKMSGKALKDSTNTRKNYEKRIQDEVKIRKVERNLCKRNNPQENTSKEVAHIKYRDSGIEDNIMIAREYTKHREGSTKSETEKFKLNNVNYNESNGIIGENVDIGAAEKADEQIEIIPESLEIEAHEKVYKNIEKSNLNIEIIHESLEMEGEENIKKFNDNIEIIPESLDLEGQEILGKNIGKLNDNIEIIPESLDLESQEISGKNIGKFNDNIEIIPESLDLEGQEILGKKIGKLNDNIEIIPESLDLEGQEILGKNIGKLNDNIEIIPESLDLEGEEILGKKIGKLNDNIEIIPESLDLEGQEILGKNIGKLNDNIEIIPESWDLEGQEILGKNIGKLNDNIEIIPESLDLEGQEILGKKIGKLNDNIEIIPESLDLEGQEILGKKNKIVGEIFNLKTAGRSNEQNIEIFQERRNSDAEIVNKNTEINGGSSSKIVDENLEMEENCLNLDAEIVESGDWFIENSAPIDDEKNTISVLRPNRKLCSEFSNKNLVDEKYLSCKNNQGVMRNLEYNIDGTINNCAGLNNVHNNESFSKNNVEIDNFERNINQELDEGLEMNENHNYFKENTHQELINQNKLSKKLSNDNIEVNNKSQSICRRFESNHSYKFNGKHTRNDTNETINIDGTDEFGMANNGIVNDCVRDSYGAKYYRTHNTYGTDKNHGKENYGSNNTNGTNSTYGTSKNHQNSFNSNTFHGKLLEEDEEFFTNENLMTIDSLNNMEEDIKFNELEIQLKGDLIEEFCEMLQDLEDDERFDKNLLKSFIRNLRGAPMRKLAFDTMGNVLVDGVKVVPDLEENREIFEENENFDDNFCSMYVDDERNSLEERVGKVVQTMETQENSNGCSDNLAENSKILSKKSLKMNISSRNCGPDPRVLVLSEDSSKMITSTENHCFNVGKYRNSQISSSKMNISPRNHVPASRMSVDDSSKMNNISESNSFNVGKSKNSQIISKNRLSTVNSASNSMVLNSFSTSDKHKVFSLIGSRLQSGNESYRNSEIVENEEIQQVPFVFKGMLSTRVLGEMSRLKMMKFTD